MLNLVPSFLTAAELRRDPAVWVAFLQQTTRPLVDYLTLEDRAYELQSDLRDSLPGYAAELVQARRLFGADMLTSGAIDSLAEYRDEHSDLIYRARPPTAYGWLG